MPTRVVAVILFAFSGISVCCGAQEILQVTAKEIQQHIDHQTFPAYPPIAEVAHVQGTVVFDLRIGQTGRIESMRVDSGPPMLRQSATDCLKQWTFHPFNKNGVPIAAEGQYSIIFVLGDGGGQAGGATPAPGNPNVGPQKGPSQVITVHVRSDTSIAGIDPKIEQHFNESDDACKQGILSKKFTDATISSCRTAAELADQLPPGNSYVVKRSAFVYAATAYGDVGRFQEALPWATKAVETVKLGHDGDSGFEAAYATRAEIEAYLGDFPSADQDLTLAEEPVRKKIARQGKAVVQSENPYLLRTLVRDLTMHATVLECLGRSDEAKKKLDEAQTLK